MTAPPRAYADDAFDRSPLRRALVWLVAIKVAGIIVVFFPFSLSSFDLPKSLFSRGLEWWIGGVLLASALRFGPSILPRTRLHAAVGALVAVNLLSTAFAEDRYIALYGEFGRYLGLTFLLDMVVLYLGIAVGCRRRADRLVLGAALALAGAVAVGYAVVQALGLDPVLWGTASRDRPFGTLGNPNMFGQAMVALASAALAVAVFGGARPVRAAAATLAATFLVAIVLGQTRANLVGVLAGIAALVALRLRVGHVSARQALLSAGVGAAALALVLVATPFGARIGNTFRGVDVQDRISVWGSAVQATLERPILGWGPDGFGVAFGRYRAPTSESAVDLESVFYNQAHDWILQAATTTGIAGLAALVALNGAGAIALLRRFDREGGADRAAFAAALAALAAYWANGTLTVWSVGADWIPWVCLGAAAAREARAATAARPVVRPLLQAAALAVAAIGPFSELGVLRASLQANEAIRSEATDPLGAFVAASNAAALDGARPQYWSMRGVMAQNLGLLGLAADDFLVAAARYPYRSEYWILAAFARTEQARAGDLSAGGSAAAIDLARRAIASDPHNSRPHKAAAEILSTFGDHPGALREIVRAIELYPNDIGYDRIAEEVALHDPGAVEVATLIDEALRYKDSVPLRLAAARAALARGDPVTARAHAARALALDPASESARRVLAEAGGT